MMSLRAFHLAFIAASIALAALTATWGAATYGSERGGVGHLAFAAGAAASAVGMAAYLVAFVRKSRRIGME